MTTCPNCGAELAIEAVSCAKCGADFGPGSSWKPVEDRSPVPVNKRRRAALIGISSVALVSVALFLGKSYQEHQARSELRDRKYPFASVVAVAVADGLDALLEKKLLIPSTDASNNGLPSPARVACDLATCGGVREHSISNDGTVSIILGGTGAPDLEGKSIVLTPVISNGTVKWKCRTNAPARFVPVAGDGLPGFQLDNVEYCSLAP